MNARGKTRDAAAWAYRFLRGLFSPFHGIYNTFDEAREAVPSKMKNGYNSVEAAGMYVDRIDHLLASEYAPLFWLKNILKENTVLFDLGGNIGLSFYSFQKYLPCRAGLRWIVYDLPEVIKIGENLAAGALRERATGLEFTGNLQLISEADVLLAFGSLQFIQESLAEMLSLTAKPAHIIVNRTPVHADSTFITLHTMGPLRCPYRVVSRSEFMDSLTALGYRLVDHWSVHELSCHVRFRVRKAVPFYSGFYFRL